MADFLQTIERRYVASATAHEDLRRSMESLSLFGGCGNNLANYVERIEQDAELYAILAPQELGQAQIDRDAVRAALCNLTGDVLTALHARMPNHNSLDTIPRATLFTHLSAIAAQRRVRHAFRRATPPPRPALGSRPPPPRPVPVAAPTPQATVAAMADDTAADPDEDSGADPETETDLAAVDSRPLHPNYRGCHGCGSKSHRWRKCPFNDGTMTIEEAKLRSRQFLAAFFDEASDTPLSE